MPKKKGIKCDAVTCDKKTHVIKPCIKEQVENEDGEITIYCENHQYFLNFTPEIIEGIKTSTNNYISCGRCRIWHNGKTSNCVACLENNKQNVKKKKENNAYLKCKLIFPNTCDRCQFGALCDKKFCEKHQHMEDYTEEMLKNLRQCGCGVWLYSKLFCGFDSCQKCRNRGKKNRTVVSDQKKLLPMCTETNCHNHVCENGYCGIHKNVPFVDKWLDELQSKNLRPCPNYIRGCKSELNANCNNSYCQICLKNAQTKDKDHRDKIHNECKNHNKQTIELFDTVNILKLLGEKLQLLINDFTKDNVNKVMNKYGTSDLYNNYNQLMSTFETIYIDDQLELDKIAIKTATELSQHLLNKLNIQLENSALMCIKCIKINLVNHFLDQHGHITTQCLDCRKTQQIIEENRPDRIRDYKTYDSKPEVKEKKAEWRENNPEKIKLYDLTNKNKKIQEQGDDFYVNNAKQSQKWRDNNPEKVLQNNETKKASKFATLKYYKHRATTNNIQWQLTDEYALHLITCRCNYCDEFDKYELTGIDRLDNNLGYIDTNVVSCCEICNNMKHVMSEEIYRNKIRHILSKMFISDEIFKCSKLFKNSASCSLKDYKARADEKFLEFTLTNEEFEKLKRLDCYMCGKESSNCHINGIDRIDNKNGYILENCLPCCWDCNKLKKEWDLYDVVRKLFKTIFPNKSIDNIEHVLKSYLKCMLHNTLELINSPNNIELQEKLLINPNKVAQHNYNTRNIEKYGEVNFKRLRALKEQLRLANDDIIKIKNIQTEIDSIEQNPNIEHKKKKCSKEEQQEKNNIRKERSRENMKNKMGDENWRRKMAKDKADQRKKKKMLEELNK